MYAKLTPRFPHIVERNATYRVEFKTDYPREKSANLKKYIHAAAPQSS